MNYTETLMWRELNEAPAVLKVLQEKSSAVLQEIVKAVKESQITNVYTAARGTSDHAMIFFQISCREPFGTSCGVRRACRRNDVRRQIGPSPFAGDRLFTKRKSCGRNGSCEECERVRCRNGGDHKR